MLRAVVIALLSVCGFAAHVGATPPTWADLSYASNWRQGLDLYIPQDRPGPYPVVIYIHGGGWVAGDKSLAGRYVDDLMERGFAVAAINYRYSYQANFPAQINDCKGAVRWLRAHANQYGLDPTRFAAFGESAGANLATLIGTVSGNASLEGTVGGNTSYSSGVQAVVDGYGPTDLFALAVYSDNRATEITDLIGHDIKDIIAHRNSPAYASWVALVDSANPANHAAGDDPPVHIVHGTADSIIPPSQSELLADALQAAGASESLRLMPGAGHTIPDSELPDIYNFLFDQLAPTPELISVGGAKANDSFGQSIAVLGDIDGDGVDDFIVGAPFNDDKGIDAGRVSVISGASGATLRTIRGRSAGDRFGFSVAGCGDVNGDGKPDFVVGAPLADANGSHSGRVEVFAGGTWKRLRAFEGEHGGDQLGYSVAASDVDGDGRRDIIGGAPFANASGADAGAVLAFSSADGSLLHRFKGIAQGDRFGWSVADAGDVDGDGRGDVVIGAPLNDAGGANAGSITVMGYNGAKWITRLSRNGAAGEQLGFAVAGAGDVDGDGKDDVVAGAPRGRSGGVMTGVARVFSPAGGGAGGLLVTLQPVSGQAGEQFGAAVASAGDADGDNHSDVVIGSPRRSLQGTDRGRASIFGGSGILLQVFDGPAAGARFGACVAGPTDQNRDGQPDVFVGANRMVWSGTPSGVVYILSSDGSP